MTWANVDDLFPEHPKVLAAGGDAGWLYICGLCFTNRNLTEGRIPKAVIGRLSDRKNPVKLAKTLVDVGLWHEEKDHYVIHDWDKYNESAEDVKARKEHARNAARARWSGKGKPPPSNPQLMPGAMQGASGEQDPSMMLNPDRAMPSHSSPTPSINSSSSNHQSGGRNPDDDELSPIRRALALITDRRIAAAEAGGALIQNPGGYRRKVLEGVDLEFGDDAERMLAEGDSPEAVADALAAPRSAAARRYPTFEPDVPDEPVADPEVARARIAEMSAGIGRRVG